MRKILVFGIVLVSFFSCGTIVDNSKILGKWDLFSVEYYQYNSSLDSYKKVTGGGAQTATEPLKNSFFWSTISGTCTIEFLAGYQFFVTNGAVVIVNQNKGKWSLDTFENSLSLVVYQADVVSDPLSIWENGFSLKIFWPLANNNQLELTIDAADFGKEYFDIPVLNGTIKVKYIKGIFTKNLT